MQESNLEQVDALRKQMTANEYERENEIEYARKQTVDCSQFMFAVSRINMRFNANRTNLKRRIAKLMTDPGDDIRGHFFISKVAYEKTTYKLGELAEIAKNTRLFWISTKIAVSYSNHYASIWERVEHFDFRKIEEVHFTRENLSENQKTSAIKRILKQRGIKI